jgi:hypothetical protein
MNNPPAPSSYGYEAHAPPSNLQRPQMPPPSSPTQQQQQQHPSHLPRPSYASAYGANRELPGLGSMHRPGSSVSMSISSLIGGDTGAPTTNHSMQPPSGPRPDFAPFHSQPSPDRRSRAPEGRGFFVASPTLSHSNQGSPELDRQSLPPSNYKYLGPRLYGPSPSDASSHDARQPPAGIPPRPNSQPMGLAGNPEEARSPYDALVGERRRTLGNHSRPNAAELLAGISQGAPGRDDRPITVHPMSQSAFSPPRDQTSRAIPNEPPRSLWRHPAPSEIPRETIDTRREEPAASQRQYGPYPSPSHATLRYDGSGPEDMVRQRSIDRLNNRVVEQYHTPPTSDPNSHERHKTEPLARSLSSSGRSLYDYPRKMGEEMQHSKSHIGFGLEASRRTGRASPLPQAVQGAQAQPLSIGKDPGVKSEFGRMFSGLGSGLGLNTSSRGSPMPFNGQGSFSHDSESGDMSRLQRVNSQQGRKPKRVKDEDGFDVDSADGRGTPSGLRGAKRNKHTHPGHHHHHAPHHQYVHPSFRHYFR